MNQQPAYLNALEAAEYLGVNKQRVYELARGGRIGRQIGGFWLFTKAELEEYNVERSKRPKGGRPRKQLTDPALLNNAEEKQNTSQ